MKYIIIALLSILSLTVEAQQNHFILSGKIAHYKPADKVYFTYYVNEKVISDSITINNGEFQFKGQVEDVPVSGMLILNHEGVKNPDKPDMLQIYVEGGTILVKSSTDSLMKAEVKGTLTNDDFNSYQLALAPVKELQKQKTKIETRSLVNKNEELAQLNTKIDDEYYRISTTFIQSHPNSYFCLLLINNYFYSKEYADLNKLFLSLSASVKETSVGHKISDQLNRMKNATIGGMAADFALPDTAGKIVKLSSFRGKYVLIDLWASWCGPCRAENPNVVKAFNKYKDHNFTVLGISLDGQNSRSAWLAAIKKDGLNWTQLSDLKSWDCEVVKLYGVQAIPQNFLLDPQGRVIARNIRGELLDKKLAEVITMVK